MTFEAQKKKRLALVTQDRSALETAIRSAFASQDWSMHTQAPSATPPAAGAATGAPCLSEPAPGDADLVILEVAGNVNSLTVQAELDWALENAKRRAMTEAPGSPGLVVLLMDQRVLVADGDKSAYGIASAEVKAAARTRALAVAPGLRLGVIIAELSSPEAAKEIAAAVRLLSASPAMTGVVIELE